MSQSIQCAVCGTVNRTTAGFCKACGNALEKPCPQCRARNRIGAHYCAQCGATLDQPLLRNRYRVRGMLGQGGMSAVYQAEDTQLFDRRCVVKEIRATGVAFTDWNEAKRNFEREAKVLASLQHPAVPQIYEYFVEGDRFVLVMELVQGRSLAERIAQEGALPGQEALRIAFQIGDVLAYLADQNPPVVHRDVKPDNIILRGNPEQAVLVDFGIAKPKIGRGKDTAAWGTMGFAAPEQAAGRAESRSDVYSLAATTYYTVTGDHPGNHPFMFPQLHTLPKRIQEVLEPALGRVHERPDAKSFRSALARLVAPKAHSQLRLLKAETYLKVDRKTEKPKGAPTHQFQMTDTSFYVCLRFANQESARQHQHRLFIRFFQPDGQPYTVRTRRQPIVVALGQQEVYVAMFGLYIARKKVVHYPGVWQAVIYLDEQMLTELSFELVR